MSFGQVVVGPPGSGKTTYCFGLQQFMTEIGRKAAVVNLDPANDLLPYPCSIDINELITLQQVMAEHELGPNGGLVYCMEYLEKNLDWLLEKLTAFSDHYFLFDCPGQVELYTHHQSVRNIVQALQKANYRLCSIQLVDSYYCSSATNYISALLVSLATMLQLELPHVNVLSKIDLIEKYGRLDFNLEFYTNVGDLEYLHYALDNDCFSKKFKKLNRALCEVIEDFHLVSFHVLNINDKQSVYKLLKAVDKANGYCYSSLDKIHELSTTIREEPEFEYYKVAAVQERYMECEDDEDNNPTADKTAEHKQDMILPQDQSSDTQYSTFETQKSSPKT
jgi:GTPase SAR1 family protein